MYTCQHLFCFIIASLIVGLIYIFIMITDVTVNDITDIDHLFMCSWPFGYHIFIKRMCAQVICSLLGCLECSCVSDKCKDLFLYLDINSLPHSWFRNVCFLSCGFFFNWLLVSFNAQRAFLVHSSLSFISHCLCLCCVCAFVCARAHMHRNHGQI